MYYLVRIIITTLLGLGSGCLTLSFTKKKDSSGRYMREVGYPLFWAKVLVGVLIGIGVWIPIFPVLRGVILAIIVGIPALVAVYTRLDSKKDTPVLAFELLILGIVAEAIGTHLLKIWF